MNALLCDLAALVRAIPRGATLAIPSDYAGVSMAATREIARQGIGDLHLICVPIAGLQAEILIGAGLVRTVETSAVTLGEYGPAPRFVAALRAGKLAIKDSTCPAIHAALQAGQKGLPFMPLRGLIGSDVLARRPDWKVIDNPFAADDPIVALPAIRPDIALLHAPLADREGNVYIGRFRELLTMAHAAKHTLVTVEEISERNLFDDPQLVPGVIPAIYVSHVTQAKRGAAPIKFGTYYPEDEAAITRYVSMAKTEAGFQQFLAEWLAQDLPAAA